jgi:hypothetical protein
MSQAGGSSTASAAASSSVGTDKMASLAPKFAQLNEILDANEAVDWAELSSAKENVQRLRKLQSALQKEVDRLGPLKESSADVLQDFNLKTAELAGAEEDVEHALKQISDIVPSLYKKANLYQELQKKLDAKSEPVFKEEARKLEARRKPIEELYGLVSPPADAKTNLDAILSKIPTQANVSKVTTTAKPSPIQTAATATTTATTATTVPVMRRQQIRSPKNKSDYEKRYGKADVPPPSLYPAPTLESSTSSTPLLQGSNKVSNQLDSNILSGAFYIPPSQGSIQR